ncbi:MULTISPECIES: MFS transporter [Brevibacterium]|uniref:Major Facilitator Superfamily protein n=2 Tax=Brevibacterium antiquum TaxID=234835 RepID=A0A2H1KRT0_9MICO|nr:MULTISPECIES: MFS transporter [Brevibacterium]SMX87980.1 Major Facilitator Superfamily protein [Brevibacterium antiquum]SMY02244.1 Major Facilitator Superfamily protein [Brevibacterium antiquum CNRZ 918]HCG54765.1 MFS transporter [Brevibacterium sp.]
MTDRPRGGLAALCIAELVSWGLLYYSLPVAVTPISADMGWSQTTVTAALTMGLIVSALAGVRVGRLLDSHGPRALMSLGTVIGIVALLLVAAAPNLIVFFLAWVLAGFAQAATLYPPAFAVVTRWYGADRVKPLTTITLVGGLASTVFAPLIAWLIDSCGWRTTYVVLAGILAVTALPMHLFFLNRKWTDVAAGQSRTPSRAEIRTITRSNRFILLQLAVALSTFTLFAVTINIIPLLIERGAAYGLAAIALGLVGFGQVAGRIFYPALERHTTSRARTVLLFACGAIGLWLLAFVPGPIWLLIGFGMLAGGVRGCITLLQATAVADRWGTANFGAINGVFVAPITVGTALAPVAGPALAGVVGGYPMMAIVMAALLTGATVLSAKT